MSNKELITELRQQLDDERKWGNEQRDRADKAEQKNKVLSHIMKEAIKLAAFLVRDGL